MKECVWHQKKWPHKWKWKLVCFIERVIFSGKACVWHTLIEHNEKDWSFEINECTGCHMREILVFSNQLIRRPLKQ